MTRFATGGRIDRAQPLRFRFNGRALHGYAGDTLASALLASGIHFVGRSFKYHRPRGIVSAGHDEPNALVQIAGAQGEPNTRATVLELTEGLAATSQNAWPSLAFDAGALIDALHPLFPAGFYYKTMIRPNWHVFEPSIRRAAGLGVAPAGIDPDLYVQRYAHCDVLVVGGGPAGLMAAQAAAESGARVVLADENGDLGGTLLWREAVAEGLAAGAFAAQATAQLRGRSNVTILTRTQATGLYDGNYALLCERPAAPGGGRPALRLWKVRARQIVLATGLHERPLVFPNNDRPGILLASAALKYRNHYAVGVGARLVAFINNDMGAADALALHRSGVTVAAVIDIRDADGTATGAALAGAGIAYRPGSVIRDTAGRRRVRSVQVCGLDGGGSQWIACDAVIMSGGFSPAVHLFCQAGGKLRFDESAAMFLPDRAPDGVRTAGGLNGAFGLDAAFAQGAEAGAAAAMDCGFQAPSQRTPIAAGKSPAQNIAPLWRVDVAGATKRQWVDFQNDVTDKDIGLAAREGYTSVEQLKRYTTTGMGTDQGKTSNVNAIAILGLRTQRTPQAVGTTTYRPPYTPLTFGTFAGQARGLLQKPMYRLPTHDMQAQEGAVFLEAGRWQRPDFYPRPGEAREDAVRREMRETRGGVGLFDASSLGKLLVSGRDAGRFLDHVYINRASNLAQGRVRYGLMASEHGIALDDGVFARLGEHQYLVSPSSGMTGAVFAHMQEWLRCEWPSWQVAVQNVTPQWATLAVAGPKARALLTALGTDIDLDAKSFAHMSFRDGRVGAWRARVFRVSFTGETQFEINVPAAFGPALWRELRNAGRPWNAVPLGLEALLRLRIEKGYIHVGSDSDGTTTPDDLGFSQWRSKDFDFIGRRSLLRPEAQREGRHQLVGLVGTDPAFRMPVGAHILPRIGARPPATAQGRVTSSCISDALGQSVALGLLASGRARLGETVELYFGGGTFQARVVKPVFLDPENQRLV
ncbi:MAG TPA: sarcosine oxidase subunit alpha family protein [Rhizomicrobium sp.]